MLEAAAKRTKTLPKRVWDAPRSLQDAPGRPRTPIGFGLGDNLEVTGSILGAKKRPRPAQQPPKTPPKTHLGARIRVKMSPKSARWLGNTSVSGPVGRVIFLYTHIISLHVSFTSLFLSSLTLLGCLLAKIFWRDRHPCLY